MPCLIRGSCRELYQGALWKDCLLDIALVQMTS